MARRRFFVSEVRRGSAELTGPEAEHLVRVLRAEAGQIYELSDNQHLYLAEVETARKALVSFRIIERLPVPPLSVHTTILPALIKFDRFEWLIEKATELGVCAIHPFEAMRTEQGLAQAAMKRLPRWEKISVEASQQARRHRLPVIELPVRFAAAIATASHVRLLLDEDSDAPPILTVLPETRVASDRVAVLSGPEGGWTEEERKTGVEAGWVACSLGQYVLRAETAAVAVLAILRAAWARASH